MSGKEMHIEDLITDRNFIKWVKHSDNALELYWTHWMKAHPERLSELQVAREVLLRMDFNPVDPSDAAFDEVLQRLLNGQTMGHKKSRHRSFASIFRWYPVRVAAVLIVISIFTGLLVWMQFKMNGSGQNGNSREWIVKQNQKGLKSQIRLPDGTMVWLNAESALTFPARFDSLSREVTLTGEAFFDISKDNNRPFTVHSGTLSTTALGTSFNVSAYPGEKVMAVSLVSGKVLVSEMKDGIRKQMILEPGEQALHRVDDLQMKKVPFAYDATVGWKEGMLVFDQSDIADIVSKLERWYGVNIQLIGSPDAHWRINGTFKNQSLERVLERLSFAKDFAFEIDDQNVVLNFDQFDDK